MKYDIIVIGAGPAGSTVANVTSNKGFKTLLIEKTKIPGENAVCGGFLFKEVSDDFKIPQDIIERELKGTIKYAPNGKYVKIVFDRPYAVSFFRKNFDSFLSERAVENGFELWTQTRAMDVVRKGNRIEGVIVRKKNKKMEIISDVVVAADGVNSLITERVGLRKKWKPDQVALAAQYLFRVGEENIDNYFHVLYSDKIAPIGYGWIVPKKDTILVGMLSLLSSLEFNIKKYLSELVNTKLVREKIENAKKNMMHL